MWLKVMFGMVVLMPVLGWTQVAPAASGDNSDVTQEYRMPIPPLASGRPFPRASSSEMRSNFLRGSIREETARIENVSRGYGSVSINDTGFRIGPSLTYDKTNRRLHLSAQASGALSMNQVVTAYDQDNETGGIYGEYRVTRHTTLIFSNSMNHSDSAFGQPFTLVGEPVSTAPTATYYSVIPSGSDRLSNNSRIDLTYQPTRVALIGVGGAYSLFSFPGQTTEQSAEQQLTGSNTTSGSAFYSRRLGGTQFAGLTFAYANTTEDVSSGNYVILTRTILPFYMVSIGPRIFVSLAGGPQAYAMQALGVTPPYAWTPSVMVSAGWQAPHYNLGIAASRSISGGGGQLGESEYMSGNASWGWRISRVWGLHSSGGYTMNKSVSQIAGISQTGSAHSVTFGANIGRPLAKNLGGNLGYEWMHQSSQAITSNNANPNSSRLALSINYSFSHSIGR